MTHFDKLSISLRYYLLGKQYYTALKAMNFAGNLHNGFRKDGVTPEFQHQVEIALYMRTLPILPDDELSFCVAMLHDVSEDKDISFIELAHKFGQEVSTHVRTLSKTHRGVSIPTDIYYSQIALNPVTATVKGCDRIHNVGSMVGVFTQEKQQAYVVETNTYVVPMMKSARRNFPEYDATFENMKHTLGPQLAIISKLP
jgi:(p)ppGpp synthase/HD superfamily hydrolase